MKKFLKNNQKFFSIILFFILLFSSILLITNSLIESLDYNSKITSLNNDITKSKNELNNITQKNENITKKIKYFKNESIYYIHNPSSHEAYDFIENDTTNENEYDDNEYYCVHFARDVNNNAEEKGIICGYVEINMSGGIPHSIVAFNTSDKGVIFFEPQTDKIAYIEIGKDYWLDCFIDGEYKGEGNIIQNYSIYW